MGIEIERERERSESVCVYCDTRMFKYWFSFSGKGEKSEEKMINVD